MAVVVRRRLVAPGERAVGQPCIQRPGRGAMGIRLGAVLEAHGVALVSRQELTALLVGDDVVWRAGQVSQVGEPRGPRIIVLGKPHAVGHGRAAESVHGVVKSPEGRDARHGWQDSVPTDNRRFSAIYRWRTLRACSRTSSRGSPSARSSSARPAAVNGPAFPSAAMALRNRR
jgi:hypothetical protein